MLFDDDEHKLSTIRVFLFQLKTEIYLWTADNIEIFLITSTVGWHYYYYYQKITELHVQSAKRTGVTKELISPLMHSIRTHYKTHIRLSPIQPNEDEVYLSEIIISSFSLCESGQSCCN